MDEEKKEIKVSKSYSLPPSQIEWLRKQALKESTPKKTMSASAVLERIIDTAMRESEQPPSEKKTSRAVSARAVLLAA